MSRYSLTIILLLLIYSCSEPLPRRPISNHTQSYMKASVNLNKKINIVEEEAIKYYMNQDTLSVYYNSQNGFWYKYLIKNNESILTPSIGDEVEFEYEISDLLENVRRCGSSDSGAIHFSGIFAKIKKKTQTNI